jgi:hypothetical protein
MAAPYPLFAADRTAARLLDMKLGEFREAVEAGMLPPPVLIAGNERWVVEELTAIGRGSGRIEARGLDL